MTLNNMTKRLSMRHPMKFSEHFWSIRCVPVVASGSTIRPVLSRFTLYMSAVVWGDQTEETYFNCGLSSVF